MGDPVTMALGAQAIGKIAGGVGDYQNAKLQKQQAEDNAYIGRTRAMQTDAISRETLNRDLGSIRAGLASSGQGVNLGSGALMDAYRTASSQQRAISYGNAMTQSYQYQQQANGIHPGLSLISGFAGAAPSMFSLFDAGKTK